MYIIDTHAHLYGEEFTEDIDQVLERARQNGVGKIFLPNIDEPSIVAMNRLVEKNPGFLYPMMGLHPTDLGQDYREVLQRMEKLVAAPGHPYIGVGEVGLDYYWDDSMKKEQLAAFDCQGQLALKYALPHMPIWCACWMPIAENRYGASSIALSVPSKKPKSCLRSRILP